MNFEGFPPGNRSIIGSYLIFAPNIFDKYSDGVYDLTRGKINVLKTCGVVQYYQRYYFYHGGDPNSFSSDVVFFFRLTDDRTRALPFCAQCFRSD